MSEITRNNSGSSPMTTLQQVQTWLGTLTVNGTVSVGSSLFDSPAITAIYTIFPAADNPVSLTITNIDTANATLTGTASILGEADSTVELLFTQAGSTLLVQVNVTPPSTLQWSLLSSYDIGFGSLEAQFVPNLVGTSTWVVNLVFSANVNAGTSLSLPVTLNVATFSGDWLLQGSFTSIGSLAEDALTALAGNNDVLSLLENYFDIADLSITDFELAFNPPAGTCSMIRIGLSYGTNKWTFFNDKFEVQSIDFDIELFNPFTANSSFQAIVYAQMEIPAGGAAFQVGGQFPDNALFAQLAPGSSLSVTDVFAFFHIDAPSGFPNIEISTLGFFLWPGNDNFNFTLAIAQPFPIIGNVNLQNFTFRIDATNNAGTFNASGSLSAAFVIGPANLVLTGNYASTGLSVNGSATDVPAGQMIDAIASDFEIDASTIPAPISEMELQSLNVTLETGQTTQFIFNFSGTTTIGGVTVTFNPSINATWGDNSFTGTFGGQVILNVSSTETITFDISFAKTTSGHWTLTATYSDSSTGLTFEDIASVFGFTLPAIPPDLDLDLAGASFYYDFTSGDLAFGLQSTTYGNAAYARTAIGGTPQNFFLLDCNQTFSLSNLPLVGTELAQIENIQLETLTVIISSLATVTQQYAGAINTVIGLLGGGYPLMPPSGINGTFLITASLVFGSDPPTPLSVSLGGTGSSGQGLHALTEAPTVSSSAGVPTWIPVQKSFGPVSIAQIGVMYDSTTQALWFELDATLMFGPVAVTLTGLGIGSPLSSFTPQFMLSGLDIGYSNPPLTVAGSLANLAPPGSPAVDFEGTVTVATENFTIQAFGSYDDTGGFPSLFLFGTLAELLGGPPAFVVTGLALGFGYNSNLLLPTLEQIPSFPFIEALPQSTMTNPTVFGNEPPQSAMQALLGGTPPWLTAEAGALWFAAGITFTSFQLVNSQALLIVQPGSELVIELLGTSTAMFPQQGDPNPGAYAFLQLDLVAQLTPSDGVFSVQAALASSSFVIDRSCVLTGGFAFFVWFGTNANRGDFVLTLGGYNPGFTPPSYYPAVAPVGFNWSLDSSIDISGNAYLALTPAVLMAGGQLNATYQAGNLKAWFDANADILMRWKPFSFVASIGLTIGASYKVDLWLTSFTISVELGCELALWGPPTGGSVTLDWYVITITIPFGSTQEEVDTSPIGGWSDVQAMLPNTGTADSPNVLAITPTTGLTSGASAGNAPGAPWIVRGSQFAFSTSTPIPATSATVGSTYSFAGDTFNVYPLGWEGLSATLVITIAASTDASTDFSSSFTASAICANVPAALWGSPPEDAQGNPAAPTSTGQLVEDQIVGVSVVVNAPQTGFSAGPVSLSSMAVTPLSGNSNAALPLDANSPAVGVEPAAGQNSVAAIANATAGIGAPATIAARNAIYEVLQKAGCAPQTANASMTIFASQVACAFAAEPLLIEVSA